MKLCVCVCDANNVTCTHRKIYTSKYAYNRKKNYGNIDHSESHKKAGNMFLAINKLIQVIDKHFYKFNYISFTRVFNGQLF